MYLVLYRREGRASTTVKEGRGGIYYYTEEETSIYYCTGGRSRHLQYYDELDNCCGVVGRREI
jgi:hypothetical protein